MIFKNIFRVSVAAVVAALILVGSTFAHDQTFGDDMKIARYSIESVFCSGCVAGIKSAVGEIEGVESISVDVENHSLTVVFDSSKLDAEALQVRITKETTFKLAFIDVQEVEPDAKS